MRRIAWMCVLSGLLPAVALGDTAAVLRGKPLAHWLRELGAADQLSREEAIEVLGGAGPRARAGVPALEAFAEGPAPGHPHSGSPGALENRRTDTRRGACTEGRVEQPNQSLRLEALTDIILLGPAARPTIPGLIALLADHDTTLRNQAGTALERMGADAVPPLAEALDSTVAETRNQAVDILARLGEAAKSAAPALRKHLHDADGGARRRVIQALWQIDHNAVEILPVLTRMRQNPLTAAQAFETLSQLQPRPPEAVALFQSALKDKNAVTRVRAAEALWDIRRQPNEVMPVLTAELKDPKSPARVQVYQVLQRMGPAAKAAVPIIANSLTAQANLDGNALATLTKLGPAPVKPLIDTLSDQRFQWQLPQYLGQMGEPAVGPLVKALDGANDNGQQCILNALGQIGPEAKAAVPKLTEYMQSANQSVRQTAITTLGQVGPRTAAAGPALLDLVEQEKNTSIRQQALNAVS